MFDNKKSQAVPGSKALEMTMRDVLDGLEDLAAMKGLETPSCVMEILAIEPPRRDCDGEPIPPAGMTESGDVVDFACYRRRSA